MKQFIRHSFLSLTIIFSMYSIIYFMNSCSDGSDTSESSFLTQPCSKTWEDRYSMLSIDLSWVLNDGELATEDNQTSDTVNYKVSSKDDNTIVYTITGDNDGMIYTVAGNTNNITTSETKEQFENKCEQTKTLFNRKNSSVYDKSKTISGKTYDCKYLTTTLTPEEASKITGNNSNLVTQATSSIVYHSYVTSKEMFTLSYELLFEVNGKKYAMKKNIESIN